MPRRADRRPYGFHFEAITGMSRERFAQFLRVSPQSLAAWETDKAPFPPHPTGMLLREMAHAEGELFERLKALFQHAAHLEWDNWRTIECAFAIIAASHGYVVERRFAPHHSEQHRGNGSAMPITRYCATCSMPILHGTHCEQHIRLPRLPI